MLLDGPLYSQDRFSFMGIMLSLHVDLFASLPGELFLGFMGLLFCVAIVSGVVLYGPFMKKLEFGTVRASRSTGSNGWTCTTCWASSRWSGPSWWD